MELVFKGGSIINGDTGEDIDLVELANSSEEGRNLVECLAKGFTVTAGGRMTPLQAIPDYACFGERTCEIIGVSDNWVTQQLEYALSCGHVALGERPNFCPRCGARVVR